MAAYLLVLTESENLKRARKALRFWGEGGKVATRRIGLRGDSAPSGSAKWTRRAAFGVGFGLWGRGMASASSSAHKVIRFSVYSSDVRERELEPKEEAKLALEGVGLSGSFFGALGEEGDRGDPSTWAKWPKVGSVEEYWRAEGCAGGSTGGRSLKSRNKRDCENWMGAWGAARQKRQP
jgi:hypothetical protein